MTQRMLTASVAMLLLLATTVATTEDDTSMWMAGFWTATSDEDKTPPDVMEFRSDGTWANYGHKCAVYSEKRFHVHEGDIYVLIPLAKGPIALVFHPNYDKTRLTFTSPRTRNNAVYKRLPGNPCK